MIRNSSRQALHTPFAASWQPVISASFLHCMDKHGHCITSIWECIEGKPIACTSDKTLSILSQELPQITRCLLTNGMQEKFLMMVQRKQQGLFKDSRNLSSRLADGGLSSAC